MKHVTLKSVMAPENPDSDIFFASVEAQKWPNVQMALKMELDLLARGAVAVWKMHQEQCFLCLRTCTLQWQSKALCS